MEISAVCVLYHLNGPRSNILLFVLQDHIIMDDCNRPRISDAGFASIPSSQEPLGPSMVRTFAFCQGALVTSDDKAVKV